MLGVGSRWWSAWRVCPELKETDTSTCRPWLTRLLRVPRPVRLPAASGSSLCALWLVFLIYARENSLFKSYSCKDHRCHFNCRVNLMALLSQLPPSLAFLSCPSLPSQTSWVTLKGSQQWPGRSGCQEAWWIAFIVRLCSTVCLLTLFIHLALIISLLDSVHPTNYFSLHSDYHAPLHCLNDFVNISEIFVELYWRGRVEDWRDKGRMTDR